MFTRSIKYAICGLALCGATSFTASALAYVGDECTFVIGGIPAGVMVYNDNDPSVVRNFRYDAAGRCIIFTSSVSVLKRYLLLNNSVGFQTLGAATNRSRGVVMFNPYNRCATFTWGPYSGDLMKAYDIPTGMWGKCYVLPVSIRRI